MAHLGYRSPPTAPSRRSMFGGRQLVRTLPKWHRNKSLADAVLPLCLRHRFHHPRAFSDPRKAPRQPQQPEIRTIRLIRATARSPSASSCSRLQPSEPSQVSRLNRSCPSRSEPRQGGLCDIAAGGVGALRNYARFSCRAKGLDAFLGFPRVRRGCFHRRRKQEETVQGRWRFLYRCKRDQLFEPKASLRRQPLRVDC
jgi:hypothetical protein